MADPRHPKGGASLEYEGQAVSLEPIEGGVCMVNCSLPLDHKHRVVWREPTAEEKKQRKRDAKAFAVEAESRAMLDLRLNRDALLTATDYMEFDEMDELWVDWRQALRDLPETVADPLDPEYPEPPEVISALYPWRSLFPDENWESLGAPSGS